MKTIIQKPNIYKEIITDVNKMKVGKYSGFWSGYTVYFYLDKAKYVFNVEDGIRAMNVLSTIEIFEDGRIEVTTDK